MAHARWQNDGQLHLTLRFIGEVDRHRAEDIVATLGTVTAVPIALALEGTGSFGPPGREHSLWAGVRADPALAALKHAVDRALVGVGLPPEQRAFRPHVTLARLPSRAGPVAPWLARTAGFTLAPAAVDHATLFESRLGSEGAYYAPIAHYALNR